MAGESPGREQQQETSGEGAGRMTADPRLAVFRAPLEVREARVVADTQEEHAGASGGSVPSRAPRNDGLRLSRSAPPPRSGVRARPHSEYAR